MSTESNGADNLLDEQVAYYRALAADYLDQGLDLPGGDELAEALDAFRPAGAPPPSDYTSARIIGGDGPRAPART